MFTPTMVPPDLPEPEQREVNIFVEPTADSTDPSTPPVTEVLPAVTNGKYYGRIQDPLDAEGKYIGPRMFVKGGVAGPGRKKNPQRQPTKDIRDEARRMVDDPAYREMLRARIMVGEAPAMEQLLWFYAYGKPVDRIEIKPTQSFDDMTIEQLESEARAIGEFVSELVKRDG